MSLPRLVTYAGSVDQVQQALAHGADHLIVEDPRLGIRSWLGEPRRDHDFSDLQGLMAAARFQRPELRLSLNCDALYGDGDEALLTAALRAARDGGCDAVRFQDPGLMQLLRQVAPELQAELATEMAGACIASVAVYAAEGFAYQCLSNDWPQADLQQLRAALPQLQCEILVHGPVLIQYSARRQLSAHGQWNGSLGGDSAALPATPWHTVVVDGRPYPFADNYHGNLMYNTFDRSLYPHLDLLQDLQLSGWLIDGRGQSPEYLQRALSAFAAARQGGQGSANPDTWAALQASAPRRFKPGFFLANNTDRCFEDCAEDNESLHVFGEVIDVIRDGPVTIQMYADLPQDPQQRQGLYLATPEGRRCAVEWPALRNLSGNAISAASAGDILQMPWSKGCIPGSKVLSDSQF
ncbi:MAG: hypothetical protein EA402_01530 [Planctomycetota bacterium]|nr:MAG: hypothetical protein EA402_01530 [Planctomycetota bacterium]